MKKTKKIFVLAGTMLMSVSLLAGCQPPNDEKHLGTVEGVSKEEKVHTEPERKWVNVGERFPDTRYDFAGFLDNGNSLAIRYYEDKETKTDYYTITNRKVKIKGMVIRFGDIKPEDNKIEVLEVK